MESVLLLSGILILVVTFMDFFHTTLSGQGFGFMTGTLNSLLGKLVRGNRHNFIFKYSGIIHLLITTLFWLMMLILGTLLLYVSSPEMVINSNSKIPATFLERLYYTGFVISTLGIGDFIPGNSLSRVITTILSFSGFILLTTALTYLISVVNTVLQKKQLAIYISTLGTDINEIYNTVITPEGTNVIVENTNAIREMIIRNSSNYIFFPIVQYYLSANKAASLELQLVRLYEVLVILNYQFEQNSAQALKIKSIIATIVAYIKFGVKEGKDYDFETEKIEQLRKFWSKHNLVYNARPVADKAVNATLKSSGWDWEDVYELKEKDASAFQSED